MHTTQLQFIDVAVLASLAALAAGTVLFIKLMQRREVATESGSDAEMGAWQALKRRWLRRYTSAVAVLFIGLLCAWILVF